MFMFEKAPRAGDWFENKVTRPPMNELSKALRDHDMDPHELVWENITHSSMFYTSAKIGQQWKKAQHAWKKQYPNTGDAFPTTPFYRDGTTGKGTDHYTGTPWIKDISEAGVLNGDPRQGLMGNSYSLKKDLIAAHNTVFKTNDSREIEKQLWSGKWASKQVKNAAQDYVKHFGLDPSRFSPDYLFLRVLQSKTPENIKTGSTFRARYGVAHRAVEIAQDTPSVVRSLPI